MDNLYANSNLSRFLSFFLKRLYKAKAKHKKTKQSKAKQNKTKQTKPNK